MLFGILIESIFFYSYLITSLCSEDIIAHGDHKQTTSSSPSSAVAVGKPPPSPPVTVTGDSAVTSSTRPSQLSESTRLTPFGVYLSSWSS
ncbi:hypothetical protein YC2023_117090 [Brassica napus]